MSPRRVAVLAVILLFAAWYLGRDACKRQPQNAREEIEMRIEEVEQAAEKKEMGTLKDFVSQAYADPQRRKRAELEAIILHWVLSQSSIHLLSRIESIELRQGEREAEVIVVVAMAARPLDSPTLLPSLHADIYRFDATLRKEADGVWRVGAARWEPATVEDFGMDEQEE